MSIHPWHCIYRHLSKNVSVQTRCTSLSQHNTGVLTPMYDVILLHEKLKQLFAHSDKVCYES